MKGMTSPLAAAPHEVDPRERPARNRLSALIERSPGGCGCEAADGETVRRWIEYFDDVMLRDA